MAKVLFVCFGNICRSPLAEGAFRKYAEEAGLGDLFLADSAGTSGWHQGAAPDRMAQEVASDHGFDISRLRARPVEWQDFQAFDYIIAMDRDNVASLKGGAPKGLHKKISLLLDHSGRRWKRNIPDPFGRKKKAFVKSFTLIDLGVRKLLDELHADHVARS